jgi:tetratricopeptide (TPR) repeat protein
MRSAIVLFFLLTICSVAAEQTPSASLETAKSNFSAGDFDGALAAIDQIDKTGKTSADVLDLRGMVYLEQGKFDEAKKSFESATKLDSKRFPPRLHLGDILLREKKFTEARDIYSDLLRDTNVRSSTEKLRYALLLTYLFTGENGVARSALQRIKFPTETPAYYYAQAAWEFANKHSSEAREWMKAADRMFKPREIAWFARPLYDMGWIQKKPALVP